MSKVDLEEVRKTTEKFCGDVRFNGFGFACYEPALSTESTDLSEDALKAWAELFCKSTQQKGMLIFLNCASGKNVYVIVAGRKQLVDSLGKSTVMSVLPEAEMITYVSNVYDVADVSAVSYDIYRAKADYPFKRKSEVSSLIFAAMRKTDLYPPDEDEDDDTGLGLWD